MKLLATNQITLRDYQTIHDCALAGNYLIVFECPIAFDFTRYMLGNPTLTCLDYVPEKYNTAIHVFTKDTLNYVGKFDAPSFWMFHFINGEETENGIEIEFLKYPN